jgi:hypothetical protein
MMKKVWLILLAVVLVFGLVMLGCSSDSDGDEKKKGEGEGEGEGTAPVFQLSAILAEIGANDTLVEDDLDGFPLQLAGGPDAKIVAEGGSFVIQFTTNANWGEGLDVCHGTGDDQFEFKAGDVIKITGKALNTFPPAPASGDTWANPVLQFKVDQGSNEATKVISAPQENDAFEIEYTLTAADITAIEKENESDNNNPQNIRVGARPAGANFQITEITVTRE